MLQKLQVSVDVEALASQYEQMISEMQTKLNYERELRLQAESDLCKLKASCKIKKKKSAVDKRIEREAYQNRQLTGLKSDGIPVAKTAEGIQTYTQFKKISDYLYNNKQYSDWLLWSLGMATGLRVSDLTQLRWGFFFDSKDGSYRERFPKVEQKTGKLNNILITEFMKTVIDEFLICTGTTPIPEKLLFESREKFKYNGNLTEEENELRLIKKEKSYNAYLSKKLRLAGEQVGLSHKTSHCMRHSFVDIVQCLYDSGFNQDAFSLCNKLLNHSDMRTTMRYSGVLQRQMDDARKAVSDFLLGKTDVDELKTQPQVTNRNVFDLMEEVKKEVGEIKEYIKTEGA